MSTLGLELVAPFLGILLAGILAGRFALLPSGSSEVLSRFVFTIAMPALFVESLSRTPVGQFFDWHYIAVLGGGMLLVMGLGFAVARFTFPGSLTAHGLHALATMFSSTAYIGLPLLLALYGDAALAPGIIGAVITGVVFAPIAITLAEFERGGGQYGKVILRTATSPPVLATATGLGLSAADIALPGPVAGFCKLLGGAFVPCMLFAAGLFIASCDLKRASTEVAWIVGAKLLLHPAITWWLAVNVFALEGSLPTMVVIQAALPVGAPVFVLAQHYGVFVTRSSTAIAWSTALSLVTLPLLLAFVT